VLPAARGSRVATDPRGSVSPCSGVLELFLAAVTGDHNLAYAGITTGDSGSVPRGRCGIYRFCSFFHDCFAACILVVVTKRDTHIVLETPRLTIREFTENDTDDLFNLNSDPEVMRYLTGGRSTPREQIRDEIIPFHLAVYQRLDRLGTWAAESTSTGEFLGWFHLRPGPGDDITNVDLGYRLRRSAWHYGYATEGSRALIRMGFTDLNVVRVFAHTMTVHTASRHIMEKCGLTLVRTTPYEGTDPVEGAEQGEVEYALTRPEWEAR
jgi:RimJ/RimL family protein N-acetyltransferase